MAEYMTRQGGARSSVGTPIGPLETLLGPTVVIPRREIEPKLIAGRTLTRATPPQWTVNAKCVTDAEWGKKYDRAPSDRTAESLCAGCPVIQECLAAAMVEEGDLSARNRYLTRGGMSPAQRAQLAKDLGLIPERRCRNDHDLEIVGTKLGSDGMERCRQCQRDKDRENKRRIRANRKAA